MRIVLFTGKGGVGKTTVAAGTALKIAASGLKTLVMSTDPAHSLADAFDVLLGPEPTEVAGNLWAEQLDTQRRLEENWREIQRHAVAVLNWAGLKEVEAEELTVIPGLDELFALADVKHHHDEGPYDVLVVDCAPTGETLRLLSLPDVIQWYMERIFPIERRLMGAIRPVAKRVTNLPLPGEDVYRSVDRFYSRLEGVRRVLTDPQSTSVRLVVNPERMVIAEAKRTFTYLSLFGYRVDAIVTNRLLPPEVADPYFDKWKSVQRRHLTDIYESFSPTPVLEARLRPQEPTGPVALLDLAEEIYGDRDASEVLYADDPMTVTKTDAGYALNISLPFTARDEVDLSRKDDELIVRVGPYRRTIMLPRMLATKDVSSARMGGDRMEILFEKATQR
jgi:arsenite/tail-anchored protein-transporting ATPase